MLCRLQCASYVTISDTLPALPDLSLSLSLTPLACEVYSFTCFLRLVSSRTEVTCSLQLAARPEQTGDATAFDNAASMMRCTKQAPRSLHAMHSTRTSPTRTSSERPLRRPLEVLTRCESVSERMLSAPNLKSHVGNIKPKTKQHQPELLYYLCRAFNANFALKNHQTA